MKYITVYEDSGETLETEGYVQTLAGISEWLGILQQELILEPDMIDGNQFEQVFIGNSTEPIACIYTEEQYARIRS